MLFLDADSVAVADPTPLFQAHAFQDTGALLWPDYWASTAAPDLAVVLGLDALPTGTHESGQMLFSKARCGPTAARSCRFWPYCLACMCCRRYQGEPGIRFSGRAGAHVLLLGPSNHCGALCMHWRHGMCTQVAEHT